MHPTERHLAGLFPIVSETCIYSTIDYPIIPSFHLESIFQMMFPLDWNTRSTACFPQCFTCQANQWHRIGWSKVMLHRKCSPFEFLTQQFNSDLYVTRYTVSYVRIVGTYEAHNQLSIIANKIEPHAGKSLTRFISKFLLLKKVQ